ncbi:MAG: TIGR04002 family protein [Lachnospiraceae bacterium]|nr:TIGR04002 family protein [Lachnospiraceae bacterium]
MKTDIKLRYLTLTGLLAALITLFTAYLLHIPMGLNGGYIHMGDALIYLAAVLLPTPYAMAAGAIGGGLADLLTAPMWAPATVMIKILVVLPFTARHSKLLAKRNLIAPVIAMLITITGYYLAEVILYGKEAAFVISVTTNLIQGVGSAVVFYALAAALDKAGVKTLIER